MIAWIALGLASLALIRTLFMQATINYNFAMLARRLK
jgi:hypothetical protein